MEIGTTGVSESGGTVALIGRRGDEWQHVSTRDIDLNAAVALLEASGYGTVVGDVDFPDAVPSDAAGAPRFAPGDVILWCYGRYVEAVRVIRDDARGLVVWIPSGSARLESAPADGRRHRDVPLSERFTVPWVIRESSWTGPGIVRVAPTGRPWSVGFFRRADGTPNGAYVNLELPHRRLVGENGAVYSRDLVLDLWIDAEHPGSEDVWLKDADELDASVEQGRFTAKQADAVRSLADHAGREFIAAGVWPLDDEWERWSPDEAMNVPAELPASAAMDAARSRAGRTGSEG